MGALQHKEVDQHVILICYPLSTWLSFSPVHLSFPPDSQYLSPCLGFTTHPSPAECQSNGHTNDKVGESKEERIVLCLVFNRMEVPRQCEKCH